MESIDFMIVSMAFSHVSTTRLGRLGPDATDRSIWWPLAVTLFAQALLVCHTVLAEPRSDT